MVVGKELEIRRWLSRTHLYSSAFVVEVKNDARGNAERFTFHGAGWGHGVGLCQIGAAVMAARGFSAEEILRHYFRGVEIRKIY
jgi:stage II sporulation protein D